MSKPPNRTGPPGFLPHSLAVLRSLVADIPRPGAVGPLALRALLVLTTAPAGCVAEPMPVTARIAVRAAPAAIARARAKALRLQRLSSIRGDWA